LAAKLLPRFKTTIKRFVMIPSKGGCFELVVDGKRLYSKLETGQFPDEDELLDQVEKTLAAKAR
jgi:selenoprotein W-related protein